MKLTNNFYIIGFPDTNDLQIDSDGLHLLLMVYNLCILGKISDIKSRKSWLTTKCYPYPKYYDIIMANCIFNSVYSFENFCNNQLFNRGRKATFKNVCGGFRMKVWQFEFFLLINKFISGEPFSGIFLVLLPSSWEVYFDSGFVSIFLTRIFFISKHQSSCSLTSCKLYIKLSFSSSL